jgi:UDP-2,3-diacylglucosamine pyrophosphatase LpxH
MIIVVSDVHLGYKKCNMDLFDEFIDHKLTKLNTDDHLVLLGDLLDFWRKNCVEVTVEFEKKGTADALVPTNKEGIIIRKLYELQKRTQVHYVIGNHDYSILYFSQRVHSQRLDCFPFTVVRDLHLSVQGSGKRFYLIHGYEFEVLANFGYITIEEYENICQHLCDVRDTTIGELESGFWAALHPRFAGKISEDHHNVVKSIVRRPEDRMKELHSVMKSPEERTKPILMPRNKIEELAMSPVARSILIGGKPDETIIFGHTHSPFITEDKRVVNSGSWVTDNDFHDTYVEIDNTGNVNLVQYRHD